MRKLKTNRGASKRFKITKRGKLKAYKPGRRHLLTSKSADRKRRLRTASIIHGSVSKITKKLLPYG